MKKYIISVIAISLMAISFIPIDYSPEKSIADMAIVSSVTIMTNDGAGSGFVVGPGLIMTARHVVEGCAEARIITSDGRVYPVVGIHLSEIADIAILDYVGPDLPCVILAGKDTLKVGDVLFVVGSPFGIPELRAIMSQGIVSGLGRDIEGLGVDLCITDATVNPGNSGGAVFATDGTVVGMAVAVFSSGSGLNICLTVEDLINELAIYGKEN